MSRATSAEELLHHVRGVAEFHMDRSPRNYEPLIMVQARSDLRMRPNNPRQAQAQVEPAEEAVAEAP